MAKPDKPETPEGEKLQVKLASKMFDEGSSVKDGTRASFMASNRRNERSQLISRVGAQSAGVARDRLKDSRSGGEFKTVGGSVDVQSTGIAASGKGGRSYKNEGEIVRRDTSSTERVARSMAAEGQRKSMNSFVESNKRKQALIDVAAASMNAVAYKDEFSSDQSKKVNENKIANEVSIFSQQSASNNYSDGVSS